MAPRPRARKTPAADAAQAPAPAGEAAAARAVDAAEAAPAADAAAPAAGTVEAASPIEAPAEAAAAALTPDQDPVPPSLKELLERMPAEPGVYLMKDKKGKIIYVGKAQNLRNRVRSYFTRTGDNRAFVGLLGRIIGDIETVVTNTEKEALLLENNLIKQHRPRFNVKLVDDKNYLVLRLDPKADYPRLEVMRRMRDDGARYFGPYHSATSCRQTLQVVNRHFKLRTCTDQVLRGRRRPCLQYQIKRCDGPCVFPVPRDAYGEQVRDVSLFLDGKDSELTERLRERMMDASERMEFETAAALRDQLRALERTLEEQRVVSAQFVDQDVFGRYREGDVLTVAILHIRQGKLLGRRTYHFSGQEFPDEEALSAFVGLYYDMGNVIPDEVLLPVEIEDREAKQEWLRERAQGAHAARRRKLEVVSPRRGPRAKLVELANKNAQVAYSTRRDKKRDTQDALEKLQRRLQLKRPPRRIECYDISHLQGSFPVASMVVFVDGEPARAEYRTFKVKSVRNDDFAAMYEVLSRRLRRARELMEAEAAEETAGAEAAEARPAYGAGRAAAAAGGAAGAADGADELPDDIDAEGEGEEGDRAARSGWGLPDLIVIDGGKGQLASALAALRDTGFDLNHVDMVALAKEREVAPQAPEPRQRLSALEGGGASAAIDGAPLPPEGSAAPDAAPAAAPGASGALSPEAGAAPAAGTASPDAGSEGAAAAEPGAAAVEGAAAAPEPKRRGRPRAPLSAEEQARLDREPDRVFLPRAKEPLRLRPNTAELYVLSRIRDEAHRFAVTFHGKLRQKSTLRSQLGDIPGVGPKRQQALLRELGSLKRVRAASLDELLAVPGMNRAAAEAVLRFFGAQVGAPATGAPAIEEAPAAPALVEEAPAAGRGRGPRAAADPAPSAPPPAIRQDENTAENAAERELQGLGDDAELQDEELQRLVQQASLREPQGEA